MDTKEKKRPVTSQRRPASRKPAARSRKAAPAPARRTNTTARTKRRPNPVWEARKAAEAQQGVPVQQQAVRREVKTEAQEEVFRPTGAQRASRDPAAAKRAAQRRKNRPAVVYTDPKPFNLNRLLIQLAGVLAVALAVTLGLSVFL